MPTCPNGHPSDAADFCSVCGVEMNAPAASGINPVTPAPDAGIEALPAAGHCPVCHAVRDPAGGDFCEVCGHNFRTGVGGIPRSPNDAGHAPEATGGQNVIPPGPAPADHPGNPAGPAPAPAGPTPGAAMPRWELHATVEPALNGGTPDPDAPVNEPPRLFPLDVEEALVGRRSARRNLLPEVALDGDDGISHRHARLLRQPDGRFALLDLGSSNGTRLNGTELIPNVLSAPLADGDRIELGRWTRVTVRARG